MEPIKKPLDGLGAVERAEQRTHLNLITGGLVEAISSALHSCKSCEDRGFTLSFLPRVKCCGGYEYGQIVCGCAYTGGYTQDTSTEYCKCHIGQELEKADLERWAVAVQGNDNELQEWGF